jgi:hypothetical protein
MWNLQNIKYIETQSIIVIIRDKRADRIGEGRLGNNRAKGMEYLLWKMNTLKRSNVQEDYN